MKYQWFKVLLITLLFIILYPFNVNGVDANMTEINLGTSLTQDAKVALEGDWKYEKGIQTPKEMQRKYDHLNDTEIPIEFKKLFGTPDATATFSTYIKIPEQFVGQLMAIEVPYEYSAYRLFISDQEIKSKGHVGMTKQNHESQIAPAVGHFIPQSTTLFVTMQISNQALIRGGFVENIHLGTVNNIAMGITTKVFIHSLLIGCILIVGIFTIFIGLYKVYTRSIYIFGFFCVSIALRALFGVPFIYAILWPSFDWIWAMRAEYILTCLSTFFFVWLVYSISKGLFKKWIFYTTETIVFLVMICIICLSPAIFQKTFFYVFMISIPLFLYMGWILIRATRMKNDLAMNNLIGIVLVCIAVFIDFLNGLGIIHLPPLSFAATAFYVVIQMFFLSKQFSIEVTGRLQLNEQLQQLNHLLDEKIYERTKELEEANERLRELANRDGLTQVYNRHYFNEYMKKTFAEVIKAHASLSMLILDVDDFKKYNDFYGHIEGDQLLQYLASEMSKVVPKEGVLARYGGEEFAIVLPNYSNEQATAIAEKLKSRIEHQHLQHAASDYGFITVSIGVATHECKTQYATVNELINAADQNLYIGKNTGKNKVVY